LTSPGIDIKKPSAFSLQPSAWSGTLPPCSWSS
jgi:hypothetical protein